MIAGCLIKSMVGGYEIGRGYGWLSVGNWYCVEVIKVGGHETCWLNYEWRGTVI